MGDVHSNPQPTNAIEARIDRDRRELAELVRRLQQRSIERGRTPSSEAPGRP